MPTYSYLCPKCGHAFERFQRITDPSRARCPACRSAAERVITGGAGVIFKGSGFYQTDYRSESYKKAAESEMSSAVQREGTSAGETAAPKGEPKGEAESRVKGEAKKEVAGEAKKEVGGESKNRGADVKPPGKKARKASDEG